MAKWRVEKSRDAADWEFQWVTISPNRKYLDWSSWDRAMGYVKYEISKERKAMTKTLADMTAVERADCVGMWALVEGVNLAVIAEVDETNTCVVTYPQWDGDSTVHFNEVVTPRFDLPRTWTPDGQPELAQALAEETYFYGVQVWMGGRWIMMLTRDHGTGLMHRGKWFEHKHEAEECAAKWNHDTPTRIVRQRRSPMEVINE